MDDPADPRFTLSFDLLFRGLEVTTGGQRIHDYREITAKMEKRGMDPEDIASYLMIFKYGVPPHGGLGIGLERLTMRLLDEQNVRGERSVGVNPHLPCLFNAGAITSISSRPHFPPSPQ